MDSKNKSVITDEKIVLYGHYKKILTIVFSVLAGLAIFGLLLSASVRNTITNPQYYKSIFKDANTYEDLIQKGIPSLVMESSISDDELTNILAKQSINWVIKNSIPTSLVEEKVELLIDDIAKYIKNSKSNPQIVVRLNDLGDELVQISDGLNVLNQILPTCSQAQNISSELKGLLNVNIDCTQMNYSLDDIKNQITKAENAIEKLEVADANITSYVQMVSDKMTGINQFANRVNALFGWSITILVISILMIAWMQYKTIYNGIKYLSIGLAGGSLMVLLAAVLSKSSVLNSLDKNLTINSTKEINDIVYNFLQAGIIDRYESIVISPSIVCGLSLLGLALVIYILRHKKHS